MSMSADINTIFDGALLEGVANEEQLLGMKLEVFEALEWDCSADETADAMIEKGYAVPQYHLDRYNEAKVNAKD